jgi:hypothetical protein
MQAGYYSILSVAMWYFPFPPAGRIPKKRRGFLSDTPLGFFFQWPHDKKEFLFNNNKYTGWTYVSSKEMKIQSRTNDFYTRSYTTALTRLSQPSVKFLLFYLYFFFFCVILFISLRKSIMWGLIIIQSILFFFFIFLSHGRSLFWVMKVVGWQ